MSRGNRQAKYFLLGEAPGEQESFKGVPFIGKAGIELSAYLKAVGISEHQCYWSNVVMCRPPDNREPTAEEIACCSDRLLQEILSVSPDYVVTLGSIALHALRPDADPNVVHGIPAYLHESMKTLHTFHPAYGLRNPSIIPTIISDLSVLTQVQPTIERIPGMISIDTESTHKGLWCVTTCTDTYQGEIWGPEGPWFMKEPDVENTNILMHNAPYDIPILAGVGITANKIVDTMQMAYLLQTEPLGLKDLTERHLGTKSVSYPELVKPATTAKAMAYLQKVLDMEWDDPSPYMHKDKLHRPKNIHAKIQRILKDVETKDADPYERWHKLKPEDGRSQVEEVLGIMPVGEISDVPENEATEYAIADAVNTYKIYEVLWPKIKALNLEKVLELDCSIAPYIADMTQAGIRVDVERLKELETEFRATQERIETDIEREVGGHVNPESSQQVAQLLYDLGVFRHPDQSTEAKYLELVKDRHPVVKLILDHRAYKKLISTYLTALPNHVDANSRIHARWNMVRTATGRLACSEPNLQNQPVRNSDGAKIRSAFIPTDGCMFVGADLSQIEMRLPAHEANDEVMICLLNRGEDVHAYTASKRFGIPVAELDKRKHRDPAKTTGFGVLYGITPSGLAKRMPGWSINECDSFIRDWLNTFLGIKRWIEDTKRSAIKYGYVRSWYGRVRKVGEVYSSVEQIREEGLRQAVNAVIQMGAADLLKLAMRDLIPIYRMYGSQGLICRPVLQIHDELIYEVSNELAEEWMGILIATMESVAKFRVPIVAEGKIAESWDRLK